MYQIQTVVCFFQCHRIHRTLASQFKYALVWVRSKVKHAHFVLLLFCAVFLKLLFSFWITGNKHKIQSSESRTYTHHGTRGCHSDCEEIKSSVRKILQQYQYWHAHNRTFSYYYNYNFFKTWKSRLLKTTNSLFCFIKIICLVILIKINNIQSIDY